MNNCVDALRAMLALFPENLVVDKTNMLPPAFVKTIEDAKAMLKAYEETPVRYVWLNTLDGKFSTSWLSAEYGEMSTQDRLLALHKDVLSTEPVEGKCWKLIEYRCPTDAEFEFYPQMKLR